LNAVATQPMPPTPALSRKASLRLSQLRATWSLNLRIARSGKRLWILALVTALPVLPPLIFLIVSFLFPRDRTFGVGAMAFFKGTVGTVYLHVVLYILALVYGLAVVSDEVEGKTLIHFMLRPIPRWVIVVGKFLAAWLITALLIVSSLALTYTLAWVVEKEPGAWKHLFEYANLKILLLDSLVLVFALAAYLALFSCVGAWLRHGERWGVVFCFGWESLIAYLPAKLKWLTVMYHVQTLLPHSVSVAKFFSLRGEPLSKPTCVAILLGVTVVSLALTVWNLRRREIQ